MVTDFCGVYLLLLTPYPRSESLVTGCYAHLALWGFLLTVLDFVKEASNFLRFPVLSLTPSVLPEHGMFSLWYLWLSTLGSVGYDPSHCSKGSVCTCQLPKRGPHCAEAGRETWASSAPSAFAYVSVSSGGAPWGQTLWSAAVGAKGSLHCCWKVWSRKDILGWLVKVVCRNLGSMSNIAVTVARSLQVCLGHVAYRTKRSHFQIVAIPREWI